MNHRVEIMIQNNSVDNLPKMEGVKFKRRVRNSQPSDLFEYKNYIQSLSNLEQENIPKNLNNENSGSIFNPLSLNN